MMTITLPSWAVIAFFVAFGLSVVLDLIKLYLKHKLWKLKNNGE